MRILRCIVDRVGSDGLERRGQGRLRLHPDDINIVPLYEEETTGHSPRMKECHSMLTSRGEISARVPKPYQRPVLSAKLRRVSEPGSE